MLVLGQVAYALRSQGRLTESLSTDRALLLASEQSDDWFNASIEASNLSASELSIGDIRRAMDTGHKSKEIADRTGDIRQSIFRRAFFSEVFLAAGEDAQAAKLLVEAENLRKQHQPEYPRLYAIQGYQYWNLLLIKGEWSAVRNRASEALQWGEEQQLPLGMGLNLLALGRAFLGKVLAQRGRRRLFRNDTKVAENNIAAAVEQLRSAGTIHHIPRGLLARAAFRRSVGDWDGAARDLDKVEEIAEPGPMRLFLCDTALERARLEFAQVEAFAPLNGTLEKDNPKKPVALSAERIAELKSEAEKNLKTAAGYIETCGYHRRDDELAELQAVLRGEKKFANLPPRV